MCYYIVFPVLSPPSTAGNMSLPSSTGTMVTASSLIVVSNRLPFVLRKKEDGSDALERKASAGGLVTAVAPVVVQSGGKFLA